MTRDNTIPIQPAGEPLMSQYPLFPVSMSFQDPGPLTSQNPPDPLIDEQMPPTLDMAPPTSPRAEQLPTGYSNVPPQPSMSQFPPQPMMSVVPVGFEPILGNAPVRCTEMPPGYEPAKCEQVPTGLEPIRAEQVSTGYDLIAA